MSPLLPESRRISGIPRTVAIFDVLGIKEGITGGRSADIAGRYCDMVGLIKTLNTTDIKVDANTPKIFSGENFIATLPSFHIFSDTIIIISKGASFYEGARVLIMAWRLMQAFMSANLPLRGAVTFGEMHIDELTQIYIGPALARAHEIEASQAWAGAIVDESVTDRFPVRTWDDLGWPGLFDLVFPLYEVPLKTHDGITNEERRVINWRTQLVRDTGFTKPLTEYHGKTSINDLHPYLVRAFTFAKENERYLEPRAAIPVEFRTFWIGKTQPPFPPGIEVW